MMHDIGAILYLKYPPARHKVSRLRGNGILLERFQDCQAQIHSKNGNLIGSAEIFGICVMKLGLTSCSFPDATRQNLVFSRVFSSPLQGELRLNSPWLCRQVPVFAGHHCWCSSEARSRTALRCSSSGLHLIAICYAWCRLRKCHAGHAHDQLYHDANGIQHLGCQICKDMLDNLFGLPCWYIFLGCVSVPHNVVLANNCSKSQFWWLKWKVHMPW